MGNYRRASVFGMNPSNGSVQSGTLARTPGTPPGVIGLKDDGGGAKQATDYSPKSQFIQEMRTALSRPSIPATAPDPNLLEEFFRTSPSLYEARRRFYRYCNAYYVHVNDGGQAGDITYQGPGNYCDQWSDLTSRSSRSGRLVIDCEGFAYLGHRLLPAGGLTFQGYRFAHRAGDVSDVHIAAQLLQGSDTVIVGGPRPRSGTMATEARAAFQPDQFVVDRTTYQTQADVWTAVRAL